MSLITQEKKDQLQVGQVRITEKNKITPLSYYEYVSFFLENDISNIEKERKAEQLLKYEIDQIDLNHIDLPSHIDQVRAWFYQEHDSTCQRYQNYLKRRQNGEKREYFDNVAMAFDFLNKASPTKKVDGAWLYSLTQYWNDSTFHDLIAIYLEELGVGHQAANHVCLYNDLLHSLGLEDFELLLEDEYYHQAAIQLALGYASSEYIPEIIGFNLGYEQLPLHLLITNYELKELGLDAQYFNLHITIDNLATGHAQKSIKSVERLYKKYKDKNEFMHKLKRGYALNMRGLSSLQIIATLNVEHLVHKILKYKASVGKLIHSDKCKIGTLTINQWLSNPDDIGQFIALLIEKCWIRLNQPVEESPFWRMISYEDGKMYGVFTPAELQIIHDWIAGDHPSGASGYKYHTTRKKYDLTAYKYNYIPDHELEILQKRLHQSDDLDFKICKLLSYLAPDYHHEQTGLWSTRQYAQYILPALSS